MNIVLNVSDFSTEYVYFLDKKINIVFNGVFTKIMYSNELFLMNGIYFKFPLEIMKVSESINKLYISFQVYNKVNIKIIQDFTSIEIMILEQYKKMNNCNKKINNTLSKQLYSGSLKVFQAGRFDNQEKLGQYSLQIGTFSFIIKMSGVWETNDEIGITYKMYKS